MAGHHLAAIRGHGAPRNLTIDQGIGDLAMATEQYFRRLVDFLDSRITTLGGPDSEVCAPLVSARAAAELGLRASERMTATIAANAA